MIRYGTILMLTCLGGLLVMLAALLVPGGIGAPLLPAVLIASMLLLLGSLIIFHRKVYAPLSELLNAVRELHRGNIDHPVSLRGTPELAAFAERLNDLAGKLREARAAGGRLRTMEQHASAIRHEINNPLSTVIGNTELLIDRYEGQDRELSMRLEAILNNSLRIAEIVRRAQDLNQEQAQFAQRRADPEMNAGGTPS